MSRIFNCQQAIVDRLLTDAWFFAPADPETNPNANRLVPVFTQRVGDIEKAVDEKLMSSGVGVIVMLPLITFPLNETPDIQVVLKLAVVVTENPLGNESGHPAEAIVEKAFQLIHYSPNGTDPGDSLASRFIVDRNAVRQIQAPPKKRSILSYNLSINTEISLNN